MLKQVELLRQQGEVFDVVALGRKALEYAQREKLNVIAQYTNVNDDITLTDVCEMSDVVLNAFKNNLEYGAVEICLLARFCLTRYPNTDPAPSSPSERIIRLGVIRVFCAQLIASQQCKSVALHKKERDKLRYMREQKTL